MKSQKHNDGDLVGLTINIEKSVADSLETMVLNSSLTRDEIVVIALKRFISSHADYMGSSPEAD